MKIRDEADRLLYGTELLRILEHYGKAHLVGSYRMDMMSWNDLDVNIERDDDPPREVLFALSTEVSGTLKPYRFEGRRFPESGDLFFGCETDVTGSRWNVDVWFRKKADIAETEKYCDAVRRRVSGDPALGRAILRIKRELIRRKLYGPDKMPGRHYHSVEIYNAVFGGGILTCPEFLEKHPR